MNLLILESIFILFCFKLQIQQFTNIMLQNIDNDKIITTPIIDGDEQFILQILSALLLQIENPDF